MEKNAKNTPEKKFTTGAIQVTMWKNIGYSKEGQPHEYKTFSFTRRYKDNNGQWKSTASLRVNDLPKAIVALNKAYEAAVLRPDQSIQSIEGEAMI